MSLSDNLARARLRRLAFALVLLQKRRADNPNRAPGDAPYLFPQGATIPSSIPNGQAIVAGSGIVVSGNMVSNAFAFVPPAHASTHAAAGSDPVTLSESQITGLVADLAGKAANADFVASGPSHAHGLVPDPGAGAGSAKYLREDATWQSPPTGSASASTVEKDLGATPVWSGKFTITDAAIGPTSKVFCWQAPGPYTGKGTRADEAELQPVQVIAVEPAAGSAVVKWQTPPMTSHAPLPTIGTVARVDAPALRDYQTLATRLGKVRGNIKFSYSVFA